MSDPQEVKGKIADFTSLLRAGAMAKRPFVEAFSTASEVEDADTTFFPEFLDDFRVETNSILGKVRSTIDRLSIDATGTAPAQVAEAFRVCHMLKGSAATMGFNRLSYLANGLERIFEDIKEKRLTADDELVSVLQTGFALVEETLDTMSTSA